MKIKLKKVIKLVLVSIFSLTLFNAGSLSATENNTPQWVLLGIEGDEIPIYFSDEEGNKLSEEFLPSELDNKIEEVNTRFRAFWSATASETTQYLTSGGYPIIVPIIRRSDTNEVVGCMQSGANYPNATEYDGLGDPYHNDNILGIMYYGDMNNGIPELAQQYGLDWYKAHNGWQTALWRVLKQNGYPVNNYDYINLEGDQNLINYINDLSSRTYSNVAKDFNITFDGVVSQENPQKTNAMGITELLPYTVNVSSPAYITDLNGNQKNNFSAGEQFIVVAPPIYIGKVNVSVQTEQIRFSVLVFKAKVNGTQNVGQFKNDDPAILEKTLELDFKGAYDIIEITKRNADMQLLPNTVYELADNKDFKNATKYKTDSKGFIKIEEKLLATKTMYLREYSAPVISSYLGYNINKEITTLTGIGGKTQSFSFTNNKILGSIEIIKTNDIGKLLANVGFSIYTQNGIFVTKKLTDKDGKLTFDNLPLGKYRVVEDVPTGHTADQLVFDVDVRIDETIVKKGYNTLSNYVATKKLEIVNKRVIEKNPKVGISTKAHTGNGKQTFTWGDDVLFYDDSRLEHIDIDKGTKRAYETTLVAIYPTGEHKEVWKSGLVDYTVTDEIMTKTVIAEYDYKQDPKSTRYYFKEDGYNKDTETPKKDTEHNVDGTDEKQMITPIEQTELVSTGQNIIERLLFALTLFVSSSLAFLYHHFRKRKGDKNVKND